MLNKRVFFILLALSLFSVILIFPYIVTIQGDLLRSSGITLPSIFLAQLLQCTVLFSILIAIGLMLAKKIGFHLPLLTAISEKKDYKIELHKILTISLLSGAGSAIGIYLADFIFTLLGAGITTHTSIAPVWQKLLASFYGGITEEIVTRLFLMSLFVWIGMKITRKSHPHTLSIIVSIFLAAILFGLGHLPITASITTINGLVILRAVILNGIGGVVFGYLYWKKGLESAMFAHFTADIFLLTLLPLLF